MSSKEKPKVVVSLPLEDDLKSQIEEVCEVNYVDIRAPRSELLAAIQNVVGVLGTPRITVNAEFLEAAPELKVFSTQSVGYDPVDVPEATRRGVVIGHTPGVLNDAVANLTMTMILGLAQKLFQHEPFVRSGSWARNETPPSLGIDIQGKTLGVIGFGRIGQEVTRRMQALKMRTIWYDVFDSLPPGAPESKYRSLDDLLTESDFVSLHTNLDESTRHLIGAAELSKMKPSAFLVNTARGGLVDQDALTKALESGQISGAALDVFEREPHDPDDPIVRLPNVVCFPHIGSATHETRRAMRELAVKNLLNGVLGEKLPTAVNPEVLHKIKEKK